MEYWNAVVLAGDRAENNPVAKIAQVACKAEARLAGKTQLERVFSALAQSKAVKEIYSVGPDEQFIQNTLELNDLFEKYAVHRLPVASGPSISALSGLQQSAHYPTLVLTCDLPLLHPTLIDHYCQQIINVDADFVIGAVEEKLIKELLPTLRKTVYQFGGESLCFANLFSVLTKSGLRAIEFWQDIEGSRKKPLEVIRRVGWASVLRYKLGLLDISQAARQLSNKTGARIAIENIIQPELAIDVDSAHDYELLQTYLYAHT